LFIMCVNCYFRDAMTGTPGRPRSVLP
jgi:hypothetical protein